MVLQAAPLWQATMEGILLQPELCSNQIGMNPTEFSLFYTEMETTLQQYTNRHSKRVRSKSGWTTYPDKLQIFVTLHWLRQYPTTRSLNGTYGIYQETIQHFYERCVGAMASKLKDEVPYFHAEDLEREAAQWRQPLGEEMAGVAAIVDGTCIKIYKPGIEKFEKSSWVKRKGAFCVNVLVAVTMDGKFLDISQPAYGGCDQADWNRSGWREFFQYVPYGIMGDAGFTFNPKHESIPILGITPLRKPRKRRFTQEEKKYNTRVAQWRAVVENTIGQWKKWKILGGTYRHSKVHTRNRVQLSDILAITLVLTNRKLKRRPLRPKRWHPRPI